MPLDSLPLEVKAVNGGSNNIVKIKSEDQNPRTFCVSIVFSARLDVYVRFDVTADFAL